MSFCKLVCWSLLATFVLNSLKKKSDIAVVTDGEQKRDKGTVEIQVTKEEKKTFQWTHFFHVKSFIGRTYKLHNLVFKKKAKQMRPLSVRKQF